PEIAEFVDRVVSHHGLNRQEVRAILKEAQPQPKIIEIMNRPIERVAPWWEYREHFLSEERISEGAHFWLDHKNSLEQVSGRYQIPPEYLVAILGIETKYGRVTGHYRVLDALATLAFDYPPRHSYFREELEQFLLLTKESKLEPHNLELSETVESLGAHGVKVELAVPPDTPVVLISAEQRDGPAYRVGFHNFYVITRYNASARYAMAVHDLAQAVAKRVHDSSS